MALALDASTPAVVSVPSDAATTASFTPPAGAVLYAIALHDTAVSNNPRASTLTDSTGLTWTLRADTGTTPPPNGGLARLYTAVVATSTAMTVTATITSNGYTGTALRVLVYTGADTVNPVDGAVAAGSAGAVISQGVAASFAGVVPWLGNVDWNGNTTGAPTAAAGTTTDTSVQPYSGGLGARMWIATAAPVSGAGTYTLASSAPTTGTVNSWVAFGVRPSGSLFTTQVPGIPNVFENQTVTVATTLQFAATGTVSGGRFYAPSTVGSGTFELALYQVTADDSPAVSGTGTLLATASFGSLTASAWNTVYFSSPVAVSAGVAYRVAVRTSEGRYTATGGFFNSAALTNGSITANQTGTNPVGIGNLDNGSFIETITTYPNKTFNGNAYFVDVAGYQAASGGASGTGTAGLADVGVAGQTPSVSVAVNAGSADVGAAGFNPTVATVPVVTVNAGFASVSVDGQAPSVTVTTPAGFGQAGADAYNTTVTVAGLPNAGFAAVAVDGYNATPAADYSITAGTATVGGDAYNPSVTATTNAVAGLGAVDTDAYSPTVTTSSSVNVNADVALVGVSADNAGQTVGQPSVIALVDVAAFNATASVVAAGYGLAGAADVGVAALDATAQPAVTAQADTALVTVDGIGATAATVATGSADAGLADIAVAGFNAQVAVTVNAGYAAVGIDGFNATTATAASATANPVEALAGVQAFNALVQVMQTAGAAEVGVEAFTVPRARKPGILVAGTTRSRLTAGTMRGPTYLSGG